MALHQLPQVRCREAGAWGCGVAAPGEDVAERSLFGATWAVRRPVRVQLVVDEWVAFHSEVADGRRTQPREVRCTQRRSVQGGGGSTLVGVDAVLSRCGLTAEGTSLHARADARKADPLVVRRAAVRTASELVGCLIA